MSNPEFKPCPWCGCERVYARDFFDGVFIVFQVYCAYCKGKAEQSHSAEAVDMFGEEYCRASVAKEWNAMASYGMEDE